MATPAAAKVIAEALALTDEERAAVAKELLASLDPTQPDDSPEAVAAFKAELDRRWAAYQAGEEPSIPWSEVRARLRARRGAPFEDPRANRAERGRARSPARTAPRCGSRCPGAPAAEGDVMTVDEAAVFLGVDRNTRKWHGMPCSSSIWMGRVWAEQPPKRPN